MLSLEMEPMVLLYRISSHGIEAINTVVNMIIGPVYVLHRPERGHQCSESIRV